MYVRKAPHRPYGSGATTITVRKRTDNAGYLLLIGRKLWQDIGQPERITFGGGEGRWSIEASQLDAKYRVVGAAQNTIPRFSVGAKVVGSLGLAAGVYAAQTYPRRHQIVFWREDEINR